MEVLERIKRRILGLDDIIAKAIGESEKEIIDILREQFRSGFTTGEGRMPSGRSVKKITPPYKPRTIQRKRKLGQPTDRVMLFDSGKYYNSLFMEVFTDRFRIASPVSPGIFLMNYYGDDIEGPNSDSIEKIRKVLLPKIMKRL